MKAEQQTACTRAIAEDAHVSIDKGSPERQFAVAEMELAGSETDITLERGINDAIALTTQLHSTQIHQSHRPKTIIGAQLFDEMERMRCQAAGIGWMLGVSNNLEALWHSKNTLPQYQNGNHSDQLLLVFSYLTRRALGLPAELTELTSRIISHWKEPVVSANGDSWAQLPAYKDDQSRFAALALDIISTINEDTSSQDTTIPPDNFKEKKQVKPEEESTETDEDPVNQDMEYRDDEKESSESLLSEDQHNIFEEDNTRNRDEAADTESESYGKAEKLAPAPYTSYSTLHDEVVNAGMLYSADEREALRTTLDEHIERHSRIVGKLAGQLQRLLMANQNRHWKFDLEEGLLDASRLTRVITQPYTGLSFKQESDLEFKDTSITLLVDNSKSMLGKPIAIAASCADILSQTLERCGISVEILGFTTTELHGGPLFSQWKADGKLSDPGRLNGLRHIIYKSADVPYRRARSGFGLMLNKDLLKQNIDGEALLWAAGRLQRRPEERKILLVISDGAPIDTSTMSANRENYLVDHLHKVVNTIQARKNIELAAIGIGHDVNAYYDRAITIRDAKDLGQTLLTQFRSLFETVK